MRHPLDYHEIWAGNVDALKIAADYREILSLLCGDRVGDGSSRAVYVFWPDTTKVIKIERGHHSFQNVIEWETWCYINQRKPHLSKWFAPCVMMSERGHMLVQERAIPVITADLPKRIPAFMADLKPNNWGRLPDGRVVAIDYGLAYGVLAAADTRLVKAEWTHP